MSEERPNTIYSLHFQATYVAVVAFEVKLHIYTPLIVALLGGTRTAAWLSKSHQFLLDMRKSEFLCLFIN